MNGHFAIKPWRTGILAVVSICLLSISLMGAGGELVLSRGGVELKRTDGGYQLTLPFENPGGGQTIADMTVTLMDLNYAPLSAMRKKVVILNGTHTETLALPASANAPAPEDCILRLDLPGRVWFQRFADAPSEQEVHVIGQTRWIAGSQASLRVIATINGGERPIEDASVRVLLSPADGGEAEELASGKTGENGTAALDIPVPDGRTGDAELRVLVESEHGSDDVTANLTIEPGSKIFLTTDKPVYQPNQLMHIRTLSVHKATDQPLANRPITIEVFDGKGNKVFKRQGETSEYGIAAADFQLADEVNQGDYLVKAILGEDASEKTVQVYEYVLPKFRVDIRTDKKYYAPGDEVTGEVEARYFFGKPLDGAEVEITANCFDVGFNAFATATESADGEGLAKYAFTIPDRLVGQPSFQGNTIVQMDVRVRDAAGQEEQKIHTFHVAEDPVQIEAIAESGALVPGAPNEVYLVASRPDGSPAQPALTVRSPWLKGAGEVECDENGIASVILQPDASATGTHTLSIEAAIDGRGIELETALPAAGELEQILLRPDKGIYRVDDIIRLDVIASGKDNEPVFLDIVKNNQTILTRTVRLENGRAEYTLPAYNLLAGTLALNAYFVRSDGNMVRDTRQVVVTRSDDLEIVIQPDKTEYEPGGAATLSIAVRGPGGEPRQAALGMHIVDESVYSLAEKEPGLAKVFFAIERELLNPKIEIHGYQMDEVVLRATKDAQNNTRLSKALMSKLDAHSEYALNVNTVDAKRQRAMNELGELSMFFAPKSFLVSKVPRPVEEVLAALDEYTSLSVADPWRHPYQAMLDDDGNVVFLSFGPDGEAGTVDDIKRIQPNVTLEGIADATALASAGERKLGLIPMPEAFFQDKSVRYKNAQVLAAPNPRFRREMQVEMFGGRGLARGRGVDRLDMNWRFNAPAQAGAVDELRRLQEIPEALGENEAWMGGYGMGMGGGMGMAMAGMGPDPTTGDRVAPGPGGPASMNNLYNFGLGIDGDVDNDGVIDEKLAALGYVAASAEPVELQTDFGGFETETLFESENAENLPAITGALDGFGAQHLLGAHPLVVNGEVNKNALEEAAKQFIAEGKTGTDLYGALKDQLDPDQLAALESTGEFRELLEGIDGEAEPERAVRVRRYFPETLFYTPELITDEQGRADLSLPMADSITTWRMSAMANAKSGALGEATSALRVFKPFFIDLDLPVALIREDEVTIPVAVYNYIAEPQTVEIELEKSGWFELLEGEAKRTVQIAANEVSSVSFRIRADRLGKHPITVYAWGSRDNDAIGREIEVRPNGEEKYITRNGRLDGPVKETVGFPQGRIEGADRLFVKIYPGVFSQVVEGLDAILQMPYGCFEQTSSTTYPNLLALKYMQDSGRVTPAIEMKAREYINLGYQRLLTFEIDGGGFSVFGNPPATRVLSAYGMMQFTDMNEVYPVDPNVIERTRRWLLGQMNGDGSFDPDENYAHAEMWGNIQGNKVLSTAYIALALAKSASPGELDRTKAYLIENADKADDAYTLSILCNALLALDPGHDATKRSVSRLVDMARIEGKNLFWKSEASMSFARGEHASVETTAWGALALIEDGRFGAELGKALNWIIEQKDPNGTWGTTHGTVLALKALIRSLGAQTEKADGEVVVKVNGEEAARARVTPETSDVFRTLDVSGAAAGGNEVEIRLDGEGSLLYQVAGKYYTPWRGERGGAEPFDIAVEYDRTELRRNDTVTCQITAINRRPQRAEMVMIDVGVPPGFRVERDALDDYVEDKTIEKYTIMSRQLLIYLEHLDGGAEIRLEVPMKATLPIAAKAPESTIYEYYNPEEKDVSVPQDIIVD